MFFRKVFIDGEVLVVMEECSVILGFIGYILVTGFFIDSGCKWDW